MKKRKFSGGGSLQNIVSRPAMYLSMPYIERKPELPDLEGIEYLEKRKAATDDKVAKQKAALMPEGVDEFIGKIDALQGAGASYGQELKGKIADYSTKASADEWYVFSPEGRQELNKIKSFMDHGNLNLMKREKEKHHEQRHLASTRKLSGNYWVQDGMVAAKNMETGQVEKVSIDQYNKELSKTHKLLKHEDLATEREKMNWRETSDFTIGDAETAEEALGVVQKFFTNLGHTKTEGAPQIGITQESIDTLKKIGLDPNDPRFYQNLTTTINQNNAQVNMAIGEVLSLLPQKSRDALMADLMNRGINPAEAGTFLNLLANAEGARRQVWEQTNTSSSLGGLGGGAGGKETEDWVNSVLSNTEDRKGWNPGKQKTIIYDENNRPIGHDELDVRSIQVNQEVKDRFSFHRPDLPAQGNYYLAENGAKLNTKGLENVRDNNDIIGFLKVDYKSPDGKIYTRVFVEKYLWVPGHDEESKNNLTVDVVDEKTQKVKNVPLFSFGRDNRTDEAKALGVVPGDLEEEAGQKQGVPDDVGGTTEGYKIRVVEEVFHEMANQYTNNKAVDAYPLKSINEQAARTENINQKRGSFRQQLTQNQ